MIEEISKREIERRYQKLNKKLKNLNVDQLKAVEELSNVKAEILLDERMNSYLEGVKMDRKNLMEKAENFIAALIMNGKGQKEIIDTVIKELPELTNAEINKIYKTLKLNSSLNVFPKNEEKIVNSDIKIDELIIKATGSQGRYICSSICGITVNESINFKNIEEFEKFENEIKKLFERLGR